MIMGLPDEKIIKQGINVLLTANEHCIGRLAEDTRFQIESAAVSANHCKIYRKMVAYEDEDHPSAFLKDTRLNIVYGVFLMC